MSKKWFWIIGILAFIIVFLSYGNQKNQNEVRKFCDQLDIGNNIVITDRIFSENKNYKKKYFIEAGKINKHSLSYGYMRHASYIDAVPKCKILVDKDSKKIFSIIFKIGDQIIYKKELDDLLTNEQKHTE